MKKDLLKKAKHEWENILGTGVFWGNGEIEGLMPSQDGNYKFIKTNWMIIIRPWNDHRWGT